ncbi:MAG: potassium transporter TrkG, partial [Treponemataceae bacterium]
KRRLSAETTGSAVVYFVKAMFLLVLSVGALSVSERFLGIDLEKIVFESVSAFGTVGLSLGITSSLTEAGKLLIIGTMFAGRVGLIALAFPVLARQNGRIVYPHADLLLG